MHAERLRKLYAAMLKCRIIESLIPADVKQHCACGCRQAIIAGTAIHLTPEDLIAPTPAELFARLVQGTSLEAISASLKEESVWNFGGAIRVPDAGLALAQLQVGAGMALACKLRGRPAATLCIVDGHQSDFWRGPAEFAARRQLAIVFVVVSAAGHPPSRHPELRGQTRNVLPAIAVDGNDAVGVYRVAEECTRRARQGLGPSLIECRVEDDRDPLLFMENYLKQRRLWPEGWKENFVREFGREAESVLKKHFGRTHPA